MKKTNNNITTLLINRFSKMPGDKKIQIAMRLSEITRLVRNAGATATNTNKRKWKMSNKTFSFQ